MLSILLSLLILNTPKITHITTNIEPYAETRTIYKNATITAYNTVSGQTDSSPCISATGDNICGRADVVACPRDIPLRTRVLIDNRIYYCLDRLNIRYKRRFDISFDKDIQGARNWGKQKHDVIIIDD